MSRYAAVAFLILLSTSVLAGGTELSPPSYGRSAGYVFQPLSAASGGTILTVWKSPAIDHVLVGSLADASGRPLSEHAFQLLTAQDLYWFRLFAVRGGYAVIVRNYQSAPELALFDERGALLSRRRLELPPNLPLGVASNGDRFLFVYAGATWSSAYVTDHQGNLLHGPVGLPNGALSSGSWAAPAGRDFALISFSYPNLAMVRIGADGTLKQSMVVSKEARTLGAIEGDKDEVRVVWRDFRGLGLNITRIRSDGARSEQRIGEGGAAIPLGLVRDGSTTTVFVSRGSVLLAVRLGADYKPLGAEKTVIAEPATYSSGSLLATRDGYFVSARNSRYEVIGTAIDSTLVPRATAILSIQRRAQTPPLVATDGVGFLAAWAEGDADGTGLQTVQVLFNGAPRGLPSTIAAASSVWRRPLALASSGSDYLLISSAYEGGSTFAYASRLSLEGKLLDQPIPLGRALTSFAVLWTGEAYLVVAGNERTLSTTTITRGGFVLPFRELNVLPAVPDDILVGLDPPSIAWNGREALLVITATLYPRYAMPVVSPVGYQMFAARLAADGRPLDPVATMIRNARGIAQVASNGEGFLTIFASDNRMESIPLDVKNGIAAGASRVLVEWPIELSGGGIGGGAPGYTQSTLRSAITSGGGTDYVVAFTYGTPDTSYVALHRLAADGTVRSSFYTQPDRVASYATLDVATNRFDETVVTTTEIREGSPVAVAFGQGAMVAMPSPLRPPANVRIVSTAFSTVTLAWDDVVGEDGYAVEYASRGVWFHAAWVPRDVTTATIHSSYLQSRVRVRALNAAGASSPSEELGLPPRRRATRR